MPVLAISDLDFPNFLHAASNLSNSSSVNLISSLFSLDFFDFGLRGSFIFIYFAI